MKKNVTLVIGASENPERYSYKAVKLLTDYQHDVIALGVKPGNIDGVQIVQNFPENTSVDTVTLYINPAIQSQYSQMIRKIQPRRVIFNPGTENPEFEKELAANGIEPIEACTLVMLRTGQY